MQMAITVLNKTVRVIFALAAARVVLIASLICFSLVEVIRASLFLLNFFVLSFCCGLD